MKVAQLLETGSPLTDENFLMKLIFKRVHALHPEAKLFTDSGKGKHFIGVHIDPKGTPLGAYVQGSSYIQADIRRKNQVVVSGESLGSTEGIFRAPLQKHNEIVAELDRRIRRAKKVADENARTP